MTIRTSPGRTSTPVAPSASAPEPLILDRDAIIPGRVRPAAPLRRDRRGVTIRTTPLAPVFDPLASSAVFAHYEIATGDLDAGFAAADVVLEGEYRVGHQEQLYIENNAMIGVPREDGGIEVHGSL